MSVKNTCYLDCETKQLFEDVGGRGEEVGHWLDESLKFTSEGILKLTFGIGLTYDNLGLTFWTSPLELLQYLLDDSVNQIVHFNGNSFDIPMLLAQIDKPEKVDGKLVFSESYQTTYDSIGLKSLDLMVECEKVLGHRISLDSLIQGCLGKRKIMSGADWWKYYTSGDVEKQTTAVNYGISDVLDLYKIYSIADQLGKLSFVSNTGQKQVFEIKLPDEIPF